MKKILMIITMATVSLSASAQVYSECDADLFVCDYDKFYKSRTLELEEFERLYNGNPHRYSY